MCRSLFLTEVSTFLCQVIPIYIFFENWCSNWCSAQPFAILKKSSTVTGRLYSAYTSNVIRILA